MSVTAPESTSSDPLESTADAPSQGLLSRLRLRNLRMSTTYEDDLRLLPSRWLRFGVAAGIVFILSLPFWTPEFFVNESVWNRLWVTVGIFTIGALGLNLLTGFTGQVSLGHAFFIGAGSYASAQFGAEWGIPLVGWLLICAAVGALVGAVIGPFALRLRGDYLVIITFGLVILGRHLFDNWDSVTGGGSGVNFQAPTELIPGIDFAELTVFGHEFSRDEGFIYLVWLVALLSIVLVKNLIRTRPGRAFQAVRDRDLAAEVIGVSLFRYKVGAFAISSALAAVAGGLFGAHAQFVEPTQFSIFLSIEYVAIIIIGGLGTVFGTVLGAVFFEFLPEVVDKGLEFYLPPFVKDPNDPLSTSGIITVDALEQMMRGLVIVLFLMFEPRGLAAIWRRIKTYFLTWPFSY
mgnify:CR=1 FL=1